MMMLVPINLQPLLCSLDLPQLMHMKQFIDVEIHQRTTAQQPHAAWHSNTLPPSVISKEPSESCEPCKPCKTLETPTKHDEKLDDPTTTMLEVEQDDFGSYYFKVCKDSACSCRYYPDTSNKDRDEVPSPEELERVDPCSLFVTGIKPSADHQVGRKQIADAIRNRQLFPVRTRVVPNKPFGFCTFDSHKKAARVQALLDERGFSCNFICNKNL